MGRNGDTLNSALLSPSAIKSIPIPGPHSWARFGVERQYRSMSRRAGVFDVLEDKLRTGLYGSEEEAVAVLKARKQTLSLNLIDPDSPRTNSPSPETGKKAE